MKRNHKEMQKWRELDSLDSHRGRAATKILEIWTPIAEKNTSVADFESRLSKSDGERESNFLATEVSRGPDVSGEKSKNALQFFLTLNVIRIFFQSNASILKWKLQLSASYQTLAGFEPEIFEAPYQYKAQYVRYKFVSSKVG